MYSPAKLFLDHDNTMERFSHIAANSAIGGNVRIGVGAPAGTNATVREDINIGKFSLVGSGSAVLKDVPDNAIVVGNPARILKLK